MLMFEIKRKSSLYDIITHLCVVVPDDATCRRGVTDDNMFSIETSLTRLNPSYYVRVVHYVRKR